MQGSQMDPPGALALEDGKDSEVLNEMDLKPAALRTLPPSIFDVLEHMQQESTDLDEDNQKLQQVERRPYQ